MKKDDSVYLNHIIDAIKQIRDYLNCVTKDKFYESKLIQDGVLRQLGIIGEACSKISETLKQKHNNIPWYQIVGLRNRVVHAYFDINLEIVWEIAQDDLNLLENQINIVLSDFM